MKLINCADCGRTFGSIGGEKFCSKCRGGDDKVFRIVREYLYDNPGASVQQVSRDTEVDPAIIMKFLKQERIEIVEDENALLSCERCSRSIKSGRYCEACKYDMQKELMSAADELKAGIKPQAKFHMKKK